jgi:putative oxidoreductase
MQWLVPGVEFSAGLGVASGTLTPLAAAGLIAICVVATCTDGLKRIAAWSPLDRGDYADDVLYLPEVLYALILLYVAFHGAGTYSVDYILHTIIGG